MTICYGQGDIFTVGPDERYDFLLVFGYIGLNEMAMAWNEFRQRFRLQFGVVQDPFQHFHSPVQLTPTSWIEFVRAQENHGIDDNNLRRVLQRSFSWAQNRSLKRVITNGIINTDHGLVTAYNRASVDRRVHFLNDFAAGYNDKFDAIKFVSLNDAFIRNFPTAVP